MTRERSGDGQGNAQQLDRQAGIALWRQIADRLRQEIGEGAHPPGRPLPSESVLARRLGVNRHTVRAALAALQDEGLIDTRQGRGSRVIENRRFRFPIGRRTRFSEGLAGQAETVSTQCLAAVAAFAAPDVAIRLGLEPESPVERLDLLARADGLPLSVSVNWFRADLLAGIGTTFGDTLSVSRALERHGFGDYVRRSTEITARLATARERSLLDLAPGAVILLSRAVNETPAGVAFQYSETAFAADRVELAVAGA